MKFASSEKKRIGKLFGVVVPSFVDGRLAYHGIPAPWDLNSLDRETASILKSAPLPISKEDRYNIMWSMCHMRFNRLFRRDCRLQEAITWELLKRSYTRLQAMS